MDEVNRGFFGVVLVLFRALWEWVKDLGSILKLCRFSVIMLLAGLAFLLLSPQGEDVLRGLAEWQYEKSRAVVKLILFFVALVVWAVNAWYWARVMLRFPFDEPDTLSPSREGRRRFLRKHVPRLLGLGGFLAVAAAFFKAAMVYGENDILNVGQTLDLLGYACLVLGVFFYLGTMLRRKASSAIYNQLMDTKLTDRAVFRSAASVFKVDRGEKDFSADLHSIWNIETNSKLFLAASLLLSLFLFLLFLFWPVAAAFFGTATILLLAASSWIPFGSMVVHFSRLARIPILSLLLLAVVLFSFWNDNHAIRTLPSAIPAAARSEKPTVGNHFSQWLQQRLDRWPGEAPHPVFVVAAEGGGIRAAYWSGIVLAALQDLNPDFADHVYAISGVSGGSLGGAVFDALLREEQERGALQCGEGESAGPMQRCAHAVLSADFLAPTVAYMLYPDLVQRFLPVAVPPFDRARAMETAWEQGWEAQLRNGRFGESFDNLWRQGGERVPALFLNSTWVETGKRVILSNLKIDGETFADAVDFFEITGAEVPLSSAVHNSARFTYVSPAGTVRSPGGTVWGHLVDGGYFENSGAATAYEVLAAMKQGVPPNQWSTILPVVIMISNDPKLFDNGEPAPRQFLNELLSPVATLLNTRNARGSYSRVALRALVEQQNKQRKKGLYLSLALRDGQGPLPLGWVLSDVAKQAMQKQLGGYLEVLGDPLDAGALRLAAEKGL
ncbi:hypothetical protein [Trichloromonas sp.]|uniref:hypothetical protein n=1 Tax=Trichloromonas sp. TaxID=3069249 RepID=UPI003D8161EE